MKTQRIGKLRLSAPMRAKLRQRAANRYDVKRLWAEWQCANRQRSAQLGPRMTLEDQLRGFRL